MAGPVLVTFSDEQYAPAHVMSGASGDTPFESDTLGTKIILHASSGSHAPVVWMFTLVCHQGLKTGILLLDYWSKTAHKTSQALPCDPICPPFPPRLPEKGLHHRNGYSDTGKDKRDLQPGSSSRGHFILCFKIVLDSQRDKDHG